MSRPAGRQYHGLQEVKLDSLAATPMEVHFSKVTVFSTYWTFSTWVDRSSPLGVRYRMW
jgi:hypothetical protein